MTAPSEEPGFLDLVWSIPIILGLIAWAACESVAQAVRKLARLGR
jgi:hypothetical protein